MRNCKRRFGKARYGSVPLKTALAASLIVGAIWAVPATADHTRFWRQSNYEEFEKGRAEGVAVRSDGKLVLAPKFAVLGDANLAYLWSVRLDSHGNLFAAGGANAKVVRFDNSGKAATVFEAMEMSAQTLVFDKNDNFYVATGPDGKVYKVTPAGQKSTFFDPKTKYIWDLVLGADGTLFVATGDPGKIFAVAPNGNGTEFYSGEETHIRTLALDGKGNLLAGTEPNGLVLRIPLAAQPPAAESGKRETGKRGSDKQKADKQKANQNAAQENSSPDTPARQAYVIYETTKREITSLVADTSGNVYVAAIGEKRPLPLPQPQAQPAQPQPNAAGGGGQNINITVAAGAPNAAQPQVQNPFAPFPQLTSSAVYRIAADGSPEELWAAREDLVYGMGLSADGNLLLGIGNQGAVIQLNGDRVFSRLAKTETAQVTGFARATNGRVYVATANPGKVFTLGPQLDSEGSFESEPFDARIFSRWGRISWWGENAPGATVEFYARAGNTSDPGKEWSPWAGPYRTSKGQMIECPPARFVQWKAVLHAANGPAPDLSWVDIAYLPKNLAPRIIGVALQNSGVRVSGFGMSQSGLGQSASVVLRTPPGPGAQPGAGPQRSAGGGEVARFEPPPQGFAQKGYQAVLWSAEDANDDELIYAVYYRGENEKDWKLLKDKLEQKFYSWDTNSMPDGAYYLKIMASDERSNPPNEALVAERESDRFVVDNTPPTISGVAAEPLAANSSGDPAVTVRFRASDTASTIVRAQYSLDAGEWTLVPPGGGLSDSLTEEYAVTLRNVTPGEHTVSVRVYDQFENESAAKVTFAVPAGKR
jgi:hypothetical protein